MVRRLETALPREAPWTLPTVEGEPGRSFSRRREMTNRRYSRRRHDLLELLDRLTPTIAELTQRAVEKVQSARGTARNRRWCASEHRVSMGHPAPLRGEFELAIMIAVADRSDACVGLGS